MFKIIEFLPDLSQQLALKLFVGWNMRSNTYVIQILLPFVYIYNPLVKKFCKQLQAKILILQALYIFLQSDYRFQYFPIFTYTKRVLVNFIFCTFWIFIQVYSLNFSTNKDMFTHENRYILQQVSHPFLSFSCLHQNEMLKEKLNI